MMIFAQLAVLSCFLFEETSSVRFPTQKLYKSVFEYRVHVFGSSFIIFDSDFVTFPVLFRSEFASSLTDHCWIGSRILETKALWDLERREKQSKPGSRSGRESKVVLTACWRSKVLKLQQQQPITSTQEHKYNAWKEAGVFFGATRVEHFCQKRGDETRKLKLGRALIKIHWIELAWNFSSFPVSDSIHRANTSCNAVYIHFHFRAAHGAIRHFIHGNYVSLV